MKLLSFLVIYIIFFLVLFAQFPLGGKIAGNTDIPASIAFANRYLSVITAVFTGEDIVISYHKIDCIVKNIISRSYLKSKYMIITWHKIVFRHSYTPIEIILSNWPNKYKINNLQLKK